MDPQTLDIRRRAHNKALREFGQTMDLAAQDTRMKYERAHFAVVGEGTRSAQDNFRAGWDRIFGGQA